MEELCPGCLCSGRKLTYISGTSVYYFYKQIVDEIAAPEVLPQLSKVCWECTALLRRFQCFQQQVKCCYLELLMCVQQNSQQSLSKPSHLQCQSAVTISFPEVKVDVEIKEETEEVHCEPETFVNQLTWGDNLEKDVLPCERQDIVKKAHKAENKQNLKGKTKKKQKKRLKLKRKTKLKKETSESDHDFDNDETDFQIEDVKVDQNIEQDIDQNVIKENLDKNEINLENETKDKEQSGTEVNETQVELDEDVPDIRNDVSVKVNVRNREQLPERPQCVECGKVFSSRKTYRYHLNVLHKGQNRHPCPKCGKVYQWKSNLGRHMRSHKARDSGELYCVKCDKSFASVATYRQHIRVSRRHVSESEFTFTCDECGKKFVSKTRLRDHVDWEHLNKIKFRCQLCNKPFKCHTSLYVHLQNVHRNKERRDNLCHVCGKSYQNAAKLKYHIVAMHTSETPYQCADCDAAFGWYSSLYRHIREVHYKMKIQAKKSKKDKKLQLQELIPLPSEAPGP
ncbi:zinc finger protein 136-like [Pieris brassicae]|uniref:zinc finger protein 136-like n=1 Tax=Pieris brassicae TaxID=7116 RepID=UPI001E65F099|nr:zinc finger protein 136-like [Pieris brassicae]